MLLYLYDSNASHTLLNHSLKCLIDAKRRCRVSTFKDKQFMYGFIVAFSVLSSGHGSLIDVADRLVL
jgi:hypothetical protein